MTATQPVRLLVGLGNPGSEYQQTRHNAGAQLVEQLARQGGATLLTDNKHHGLTGQVTVDGQPLRLLVPTTFMNHSGRAVAALANFYKIDSASILVAHDELDIAPGQVRLKIGGGHGGHNGLRDIINCLGKQSDFARLRIGIGHPGDSKQVSNYVLRAAPSSEQQLIDDSIDAALAALPEIMRGDGQRAMNHLHRRSE